MTRYTFLPISDAPRDGRTLVLADDTGWQAVGHGDKKSDVWWLGRKDQPGVIEQLEFEPTKFAFPRRTQASRLAAGSGPQAEDDGPGRNK